MIFSKQLERRGIWWHSQNLNEDSKGNIRGSKFWHGRSWLKWKEGACGLGVKWIIGKQACFCHAYVQVGGEDLLKIGIALPWVFVLWFHVDMKHKRQEEMEIGLNLFKGLLSWKIWSRSNEWHMDTPRWRGGSLYIPDFILGKRKYSSETIDEDRVFIRMPEECYHGNCRISRDTWRRSRWPWPLILTRATIELDKPIPIPGKGENSWDQGDDAVHSMTMCATTKEEAALILQNSVLDTRKRWGWRDGRAPSS